MLETETCSTFHKRLGIGNSDWPVVGADAYQPSLVFGEMMSSYSKMAYAELKFIRMRLESVISEIRLTRQVINDAKIIAAARKQEQQEQEIYEKWFL